MKKILITGANGRIGFSLVESLINEYELILVDLFIDKIEKYKDKAFIIKSDLKSISKWESQLEKIDCVIHLAAMVHSVPKNKSEEENFIKTNAEMTKILYQFCIKHKVKNFLFFSTNDVYKSSKEIITEDTKVDPSSIYGKSKFLAEKYLIEEQKKGEIRTCIFRPASVYGYKIGGSMGSLINICKKGFVPMLGSGENKKALLYIEDLIQGVKNFIKSKEEFELEIFNISSGDFSYREIIDGICEVFKLKPLKIYIPIWFCNNVAKNIKMLRKLSVASETKVVSNKKIEGILNYKKRYGIKSSLEELFGKDRESISKKKA